MLVRGELPPDPLAAELDRFIDQHHLGDRSRELDRDPAFPAGNTKRWEPPTGSA